MPTRRIRDICPVCEYKAKAHKIYIKKNIKKNLLNKYSFSSRKIPEFMNFDLVQCSACSLIYSNNIPKFKTIYNFYKNSSFVDNQDAQDAASTYFQYLKPYLNQKISKVLELGTGSGIFLEFLKKYFSLKKNYRNIVANKFVGIEPSKSAINNASVEIKKYIKQGTFEDIRINKNYFDIICCFMTMEHVYYPLKVLKKSYSCLKKNGFLALVVHDVNFILHKILKSKSPIIDIEHLQLFSRATITYALKKVGFKRIQIKYIRNSYRISYWLSLFPLPKFLKSLLIKLFISLGRSNIRLNINVGNILVVAYK